MALLDGLGWLLIPFPPCKNQCLDPLVADVRPQPINAATLVETGTTLFDILCSLCKAVPSGYSESLRSIEQKASNVRKKLDMLELDVEEADRNGLVLAEAKFRAAMLEAAFGASTLDLKGYDRGLKECFETLVSDASPAASVAYAEVSHKSLRIPPTPLYRLLFSTRPS